jgi:hypothetical protein
MRRLVLVPLGLLLLAILGSQLLLPGIAEHRVEDRLERHGGTARVSLSALPAMRLLFGDGDSLTVKGSGLDLTPEERHDALERLDGFDEVSVKLDRLVAGPLHVSSFTLTRGEGEHDYRTRLSARTSAREVGRFLGSQAGGAFGGLLGDLAGSSLPGGATEVPLELNAVIASRGGDVDVVRARGSVAGIPAGPLTELVVAAVAREL